MKVEKGKPEISIVVPFYNAGQTLQFCLEAIEAQSLKPEEVILVDNNSKDNSNEIVKKFINDKNGRYISCREKKIGPASARNAGIEESKKDVIVFTDADCIPDENWLETISKEFEDPDVCAVAGKIEGYVGKSLLEKFHSLFTLQSPQNTFLFNEFTLVNGGFPAANFAVRKEILNAIGGFDEKLLVGEDYDLCARIYKAGFVIKFVGSAIVHHLHRSSIKSTWKQSVGFGEAHAKLLRKHFTKLLILELPGGRYITEKWPSRAWFNLASADKKFLLLVITAAIWKPGVLILFLYIIWLVRSIKRRGVHQNMPFKFADAVLMTGLLLIKSAAFTTGRVMGSIKEKVLCI
jgi:cellulose synthase/poly-beta-1,6-N-acetylglucosamine synthase-like glycosyltransferase